MWPSSSRKRAMPTRTGAEQAVENRARADALLAGALAPMLNRPVEQLGAILPIGSAEECAEKLLPYQRAGAQRVFLWPLADERAQLEVFRERVMPLLDVEPT